MLWVLTHNTTFNWLTAFFIKATATTCLFAILTDAANGCTNLHDRE